MDRDDPILSLVRAAATDRPSAEALGPAFDAGDDAVKIKILAAMLETAQARLISHPRPWFDLLFRARNGPSKDVRNQLWDLLPHDGFNQLCKSIEPEDYPEDFDQQLLIIEEAKKGLKTIPRITIDAIRAILSRGTPEQKLTAGLLLERGGSYTKLALKEIIACLSDEDEGVNVGGMTAIFWMNPASEASDAVPDLIRFLAHDSAYVRMLAVDTLGKIGPAAIACMPELKKLFAIPGELGDKAACAAAMIDPGDRECVPILSEMIHSEGGGRRVGAALALSHLQSPPDALVDRIALMRESDGRHERETAMTALAAIARTMSRKPTSTPASPDGSPSS